jgi:hypothetical protein
LIAFGLRVRNIGSLGAGNKISNRIEPKSCLGQVVNTKLGRIGIYCLAQTASSRVEYSAQVLSCQLKFVHERGKSPPTRPHHHQKRFITLGTGPQAKLYPCVRLHRLRAAQIRRPTLKPYQVSTSKNVFFFRHCIS